MLRDEVSIISTLVVEYAMFYLDHPYSDRLYVEYSIDTRVVYSTGTFTLLEIEVNWIKIRRLLWKLKEKCQNVLCYIL